MIPKYMNLNEFMALIQKVAGEAGLDIPRIPFLYGFFPNQIISKNI